jgi:hypothetical protein
LSKFKSYICKRSIFLEMSSLEGLKFTLVFYRFFQIFLKLKFLKCRFFQNFKFENRRISNWYQRVDPTAGKSTSLGAFRIVLRKSSFCQSCWEKATLFSSSFTSFFTKGSQPRWLRLPSSTSRSRVQSSRGTNFGPR